MHVLLTNLKLVFNWKLKNSIINKLDLYFTLATNPSHYN